LGQNPFSFLITCVAGWMNQRQQHIIEYLRVWTTSSSQKRPRS
jgi:hypothetical protein